MSRFRPVARRAGLIGVVLTAGLAVLASVGRTESDRCSLPAHHAGVVFPLDQVEAAWACRLEPIVTHYTTANKVGPQRTPLPQPVFLYLLDHPVMAAMLINRLDLGLYKAEQRGQPMLSISSNEVLGELPGLLSVEIAIGMRCSRSKVMGGTLVSRKN